MNPINSLIFFPSVYADEDIVPTLNDLFSTTPNQSVPQEDLIPLYKYDIPGAVITPGSSKQGGGQGTKVVNIVFYGTHAELIAAIAPPTNLQDWGSQDAFKHQTGVDGEGNPIMELTVYTPVNNSVWQHHPDRDVYDENGNVIGQEEVTELHGWQGFEPFASKV